MESRSEGRSSISEMKSKNHESQSRPNGRGIWNKISSLVPGENDVAAGHVITAVVFEVLRNIYRKMSLDRLER